MEYRNDNAIIADMEKAKADGDMKKVFEYAVELLLPEAEELRKVAEKNITTKDGYGTVLQFLSGMQNKGAQKVMAKALERVGYPYDTLASVKEILAI